MSSASTPSRVSTVTFMAARQSCRSGICPLNSAGDSERFALYSAYCSVRNEWREVSKATARCVGFSAFTRFTNIDRNP